MKVIRAGIGEVALAAPLFDAYRQFYGQKPDLPGAAAFLTERLTRGNDLFVADAARRCGVARLLMDAALGLARSTGAARLVLSTAKDNAAARSLYLSLGYRMDDAFDHLELPLD